MKTILTFIVPLLWVSAGCGQDCFRWDGKINGKPARLLLDTGYGGGEVFVFRSIADRLGLKPQGPEVRNADQVSGWPVKAVVELPGWTGRKGVRITGQLGVYDPPEVLRRISKVDGGVGWPLIHERITQFDARSGKFQFLRKVPKDLSGWTKFTLLTNQTDGEVLASEVPNSGGGKGVIFIDSGSVGEGDIGLSHGRWIEWKAANPNVATGLAFNSRLSVGLAVLEQAWANKISIGNLELTEIVVEETNERPDGFAPNELVATLGFQALKRLDLIVDGKNGLTYLRPIRTSVSAPSFLLGRGGAVFVPQNPLNSDLVAHVAVGSPAFAAGIRNGDVLFMIGDCDITKWLTGLHENWRIDPLSPFTALVASSNSVAGVKFDLTLKRGDQTFRTTVLQRAVVIIPSSGRTNSAPLHSNPK